MRSTPAIVPPTSVVTVAGTGGGSRIGSWPSVARAPEVAELSRISVFGSGGGAGGICKSSGSTAFESTAFESTAFGWTSCGSASCVSDFCWPAGEGCADGWAVFEGTVPTGAVAGVAGFVGTGLEPWTGVCGTPEPGFGVEGLFCVQLRAAQRSNNAITEIGERCIEFQELPIQTAIVQTPVWMQTAATQMADL